MLRRHTLPFVRRWLTVGSLLDDPATHRIKRIVLTGGPCGGKSSSLSLISEFLRARGYAVYAVPEAATLMMSAGLSFANVTREQLIDTQGELCRVQQNLEDSFFNIARSRGAPAVILSDRGAMDGKAYIEEGAWQEMLKRFKWNEWDLREGRYDGVCHLVTAALGAESFYSSSNNPTRSESPEQARLLDRRVQHAWLGHPQVSIVDNSTPFADKLQRVVQFVCQIVGIPVPSERVKRFLITSAPAALPVPHHDFTLRKVYLQRHDSQCRVESRTSTLPGSLPVYRYTEKRYSVDGCPPWDSERKHQVLNMRRISKNEYLALLPLADPLRSPVLQFVRNFVYKDQYFSMVQTNEPTWMSETLHYVEVTTAKEKDEIEFPEWLKVSKDVTDDARFTSYLMSQMSKKQ